MASAFGGGSLTAPTSRSWTGVATFIVDDLGALHAELTERRVAIDLELTPILGLRRLAALLGARYDSA